MGGSPGEAIVPKAITLSHNPENKLLLATLAGNALSSNSMGG